MWSLHWHTFVPLICTDIGLGIRTDGVTREVTILSAADVVLHQLKTNLTLHLADARSGPACNLLWAVEGADRCHVVRIQKLRQLATMDRLTTSPA